MDEAIKEALENGIDYCEELIDTLNKDDYPHHSNNVKLMRVMIDVAVDDLNDEALSKLFIAADDHLDKAIKKFQLLKELLERRQNKNG